MTDVMAGREAGLTFRGLLYSEWIKLRTVRSTLWCYCVIILVSIGFGLLIASTQGATAGMDGQAATDAGQLQTVTMAATASVGLTQLVAAVLGVLAISSEFGTGMIRSTFVAAPKRVDAYLAKIVVLAAVTFLVGLISILGSAAANTGILASHGIEPHPGSTQLWGSLAGAACYLALITIIAFAFGALVRRSAGGIASVLALLLVVPTAFQIIGSATGLTWLRNIGQFLPTTAGEQLFAASAGAPSPAGGMVLEPWQGGLVLLGWALALAVIGAAVIKRRDV